MMSTRGSAPYFPSGGAGHARNPFCLPFYGQHITADGTAITHYMNSYIGARANTECFIGQYCAAIIGKNAGVRLSPAGEQAGEDALRYQSEAEGRDRLERPRLLYLEDPGQELLGRAGDKRDRPRGDHERRPRLLLLERAFLRCGRSFPPRRRLARGAGHWSRPSGDASPRRPSLWGPRNCRSVYETFSTTKAKPDMVSFGGFGVNISIRAVYKMARLLEGKKVSGDFPTVAFIDGAVRGVADRTGITDILKKAGVRLTMKELFEERGVEAGKGSPTIRWSPPSRWDGTRCLSSMPNRATT